MFFRPQNGFFNLIFFSTPTRFLFNLKREKTCESVQTYFQPQNVFFDLTSFFSSLEKVFLSCKVFFDLKNVF